MFSNNPRIRVDIKSEATEEDASQSVVALNRVSTLLKEVRRLQNVDGDINGTDIIFNLYRKTLPLLLEDFVVVESKWSRDG